MQFIYCKTMHANAMKKCTIQLKGTICHVLNVVFNGSLYTNQCMGRYFVNALFCHVPQSTFSY